VERNRIKDFEAYTQVPYSEAENSGEYIGQILVSTSGHLIIRIKEVTEHGAVIERESKVRCACDESRDPNEINVTIVELEACNKGKEACPPRIFSCNGGQAILHSVSKRASRCVCDGVRQAIKWRKLLYGKVNAPRGLWHDIAAYLLSLGFTQEVSVDQCLFVHKDER
jgi:hypothetical protein